MQWWSSYWWWWRQLGVLETIYPTYPFLKINSSHYVTFLSLGLLYFGEHGGCFVIGFSAHVLKQPEVSMATLYSIGWDVIFFSYRGEERHAEASRQRLIFHSEEKEMYQLSLIKCDMCFMRKRTSQHCPIPFLALSVVMSHFSTMDSSSIKLQNPSSQIYCRPQRHDFLSLL